MVTNFRVAVLDDYQHVARGHRTWHLLPDGVDGRVLPRPPVRRTSQSSNGSCLRGRRGHAGTDAVPGIAFEPADQPAPAGHHRAVQCGDRRGRGHEPGRRRLRHGRRRVPGSDPTAELTWGLILATARHIPQEDRGVRAGHWQQTVGTYLYGKTLALSGARSHGVGRRRGGPGIRHDVDRLEPELDRGAEPSRAAPPGVPKRSCSGRSDVLSIHLVLSDRTRGIVGRAGALAHEADRLPHQHLAWTPRLRSGPGRGAPGRRIAGAGLDVFDPEPLPPSHPLCSMDNVVLTPHLGYVTEGTYEIFFTPDRRGHQRLPRRESRSGSSPGRRRPLYPMNGARQSGDHRPSQAAAMSARGSAASAQGVSSSMVWRSGTS